MTEQKIPDLSPQECSAVAGLKEKAVSLWTGHPAMLSVFDKYTMEAAYFREHYAGLVFDCLPEILSGKRSPRGCVVIHTMIDYFKNRDMSLEDLQAVFASFRQAVFKSLPADALYLFDALQVLLDIQFNAALTYYNISLFSKELSIREDLQRFQEYQKAIDRSAIVSKTDRKGLITYVNKAFVDISGYCEDELIGRPHNIIRHPDMSPKVFTELWETIKAKKVFHGIIKNRKKNGDAYYVDTSVVPILDSGNEIVEFIAMRHEVTELINAIDEVKAAQKAKEEFLANMSHEIRTPLNAIMGFVAILQKRVKDDKSRHYLDIISNSGHSLIGIISDILDFSKIQSGKFSINPHPFDPIEELSPTVQLFASKAYEKEIEYFTYISPALPECLQGDAIRIKQIVANLLSNAIKFTPAKGTIKLKAVYEDGALAIMVQDSGIGIEPEKQECIFNAFEQADGSTTRNYGGTGLGLAISAELARMMGGRLELQSVVSKGSVFTLKLQLPVCNRKTRVALNTALLEALDVTIIQEKQNDQMRGLMARYLKDYGIKNIRYSSDMPSEPTDIIVCASTSVLVEKLVNSEATVIMLQKHPSNLFAAYPHIFALTSPLIPYELLRVIEDATPERLYEELNIEHEETPALSGHILIVEDNHNELLLIAMLLEEWGLTYTAVADGAAAIAACEEEPFDLLLMDTGISESNGAETVKQILNIEESGGKRQLPVIVLTDALPGTEKGHFLQAGVDGFVSKPIDSHRLFLAIKEHLTPLGALEK